MHRFDTLFECTEIAMYVYINEIMLSAIVPRIALGGACQANDVCENVNAVCDGGRCTCKQGYIQESDTCGKFSACELPLLDECSDKW